MSWGPAWHIDNTGALWWDHTCTSPTTGLHHRTHTLLTEMIWHADPVEPLTLTPDIECPDCGTTGSITGGVWVPT